MGFLPACWVDASCYSNGHKPRGTNREQLELRLKLVGSSRIPVGSVYTVWGHVPHTWKNPLGTLICGAWLTMTRIFL